MANKYLIGFLLLVVLSTSAYIVFNQNELKINVSKTSTTFYVNQTGLFETSGVEYNSIYNGTKKLTVSSDNIFVTTEIKDKDVFIYRTANYLNGMIVKDTYYFQGNNDKKENFPIKHTIEIINGKGLIYEYKVNKLDYSGSTIKNPKSPQSFGKNMKVTFQDGYYYSNLAKLTSGGELKVKYKINSDNEIFNVRLFDPIWIGWTTQNECFPGDITTSNSSQIIQCNVSSTEGISQIKFNWDGTNYSLFDSSLVLFYNFDNRSALGENSTHVKDLSIYGNNGTVYGGSNISWTPNGKYNGAFNFSGNRSYIRNTGTNFYFTNNTDKTISLWFNANNKGSSQAFISFGNTAHGINFYLNSAGTGIIQYQNSSGGTQTSVLNFGTSNYNYGSWYNFIISFSSGTNYTSYLNGVLMTNVNLTSLYNYTNSQVTVGAFSDATYFFNGTIDNLMIFNKSLSSLEVSQLYKSSLTKYNSQNWTFTTNQTFNYSTSLINTTNPIKSWNYYLCSSNLSGSENCTSQRTITQTIPNKNVIINFTTSIGNINNNFYGINDEYLVLSNSDYSILDADCDGTRDTPIDFNKNLNLFTNAKMNYVRVWAFMHKISLSEGDYNQTVIKYLMDEAQRVNNQNGRLMITFRGADVMPDWLQNRTTGYCNSTGWGTCTSNNDTKWAEIVNYVLNNLTTVIPENRIDVEIMNEPYGNKWLNNLTTDDITKGIEYVKIYNTTYDYLKARHPNIAIGGAGFYHSYPVITNTFLSNMTTKIDFVDIHPYTGTSYISSNQLISDVSVLLGNCTLYGANCSRIVLGEWNIVNGYSLASNLYETEIAYAYLSILNNYPNNITSSFFEFTKWESYTTCSALFPEYPYNYPMFIELDNYIAPTYNVTKNFATYCPSSSTVYQSSSDDSTIKTVTCKDGNKYNIILINTGTNSINASVNLSGNYPYSSITNLVTGTIYNLHSNVDVGIMDSYNIFYLGSGELNVSLGSNISAVEFRPSRMNSQDVWAVNQTNTKGIFNISNTGFGTATIGIKLNQTQSGWGIECNNQTSGSWINLTTNYQTIYSNLLGESSFQVWCRADLNYPTSQFKGRIYFNITS